MLGSSREGMVLFIHFSFSITLAQIIIVDSEQQILTN